MLSQTKSTGNLGESLACTYLERKGYAVLERNFQNAKGYKYGEIDIIASFQGTIVFVEVKTRRTKKHDDEILPEENISPQKLKCIERTAVAYLDARKIRQAEYRFDAVAIVINESLKKARVRHIENIFF